MNSKVIIALFCLVAVTLAASATPGANAITCTACTDAVCGKSGTTQDNWQAGTATGTCVVKDCNLLTGNGAVVSNNACASCSTTTPVANSGATACVAKSSAKLLIASAAVIVALLF
ncbi:cell surface immobilization antigen SerH6, putative (macronuclear) [Tetrahymena thermophila SB210]|uniref:Cell surface immobilization antigen SerH6, putative n=1 Tax=Tetrahymena thermophila (strain SB210) TaxID=312017 RepID=Q23J59_TETTS|nr:cell surface immobilization antigen SerH6, putative [Tetrahymena thermophila SB210]EAR96645.1 cell surface immobilization antigen SerH6, putative [Tetrahymena thermophila SB210]|eukprot:XP_001016890.1 cell surface immobilization antigen SerH6, putative [Tetrahymena thermophila SB210]